MRQGRKTGFTLIELLVVIASIAILAALLLSVLGRVKNQAGKITDVNNLKQITLAMHLYVSDNDDVLPPPNWDNGGSPDRQGTNTGWLYAIDLDATGTNKFKVETGLFWSTLRNPTLYFCPMDDPAKSEFGERPQQISSYAMNGAIIGFRYKIYPPVKLSAMLPTDCAFWETDETNPKNFNDGANFPGEGVSARHNQGGVQATFDGSVNYMRLDDWGNDVDDSNKNRLWCYPNQADGGGPNGHNQ